MSEKKDCCVYMVLYNYNEGDFTLVKIMSTLEKAFKYICLQEEDKHNHLKGGCKMIDINKKDDINFPYQQYHLNVCFIKLKKYHNLDIYDRQDISQYIIVSMDIE
jgi:hypothetical protein